MEGRFSVGKAAWFDYFGYVNSSRAIKGKVFVKKKPGVLDPEGVTIQKALANLGYKQVTSVRSGKVFELEVAASNPKEADEKLSEMARKLLSNPVIEDFRVELVHSDEAPSERENGPSTRSAGSGPSAKLPSTSLGSPSATLGASARDNSLRVDDGGFEK